MLLTKNRFNNITIAKGEAKEHRQWLEQQRHMDYYMKVQRAKIESSKKRVVKCILE